MKKHINLKKLVVTLMATLLLLPVSPITATQKNWLENIGNFTYLTADVRLFNQEDIITKKPVVENGKIKTDENGNTVYEEVDEWVLKARDIHLNGEIPLMEASEWAAKFAFRVDLARIAGLDDETELEKVDKLDEAIEQAEIIIHASEDGDTFFRTIRFGKGQTALREFVESTIVTDDPNKLYKDNLLYQISHKDEVVGVSVEMSPSVMSGIILEVGLHGCSENDLKVNSDDTDGCSKLSAAIRDVKVGEYGTFAIEYLHTNEDEKDANNKSKPEEKTLKIYAAIEAEKYGKGYIQLLVLDENKLYPEASIAGTIGYEKEFGPGQIVMQLEYLDEASLIADKKVGSQSQFNLSYNFKATENVTLSPYVIHKMYDEDKNEEKDDTIVGINLHFTSDSKSRLPN